LIPKDEQWTGRGAPKVEIPCHHRHWTELQWLGSYGDNYGGAMMMFELAECHVTPSPSLTGHHCNIAQLKHSRPIGVSACGELAHTEEAKESQRKHGCHHGTIVLVRIKIQSYLGNGG